MKTTKLDQALENERTEEVQHIIERMPTRFSFWVTMIVLFLFILIATFGWIIRYPDIVHGQITINSNNSPIKLVANAYGRLKLNGIESMSQIKKGEIIGYLENTTDPNSVDFIDSLIRQYNPNGDGIIDLHKELPENFSLGELNIKYYAFASALQQFLNYKEDHLFEKQSQNLIETLEEQKKAILSANQRVVMANNKLSYMHKFYSRDSTLFKKKVISESELDKTQMSFISSKDDYQNALSNLINTKQEMQQTQNRLQELIIRKPEKEKELRIALISSYNDLADNIKGWQQKYVFRAPFDGKIQFLKFYNENQYVQNGEQVFTIIPKHKNVLGQVTVASLGSGKIREGQEVIVKLDNIPIMNTALLKEE